MIYVQLGKAMTSLEVDQHWCCHTDKHITTYSIIYTLTRSHEVRQMSTLFQLSESYILCQLAFRGFFSQKRPHPQNCCLHVVQGHQPVKSSAPE